jgi:hypothetical protein
MLKIDKKQLKIVVLLCILGINTSVFAQDFSLIPKTNRDIGDCTDLIREFDTKYQQERAPYNSYKRFSEALGKINPEVTENQLLGCGITTGRIRLYFWKPYVAYLIQILSVLTGALSMLFITLGGYQYFYAMVSGEDSNAKNTVKNAILGLVLSLSSWIIVEVVQNIVSF